MWVKVYHLPPTTTTHPWWDQHGGQRVNDHRGRHHGHHSSVGGVGVDWSVGVQPRGVKYPGWAWLRPRALEYTPRGELLGVHVEAVPTHQFRSVVGVAAAIALWFGRGGTVADRRPLARRP